MQTNKRGDITITILVVEVLVLCAVAIASFISSDLKVRNSFVGIGEIQKLNAQIEQNQVYGEVLAESESLNTDLYEAVNYAKNNELINRHCRCKESCESYASFILDAASKYGIDPFLLFSIMMQESECVPQAASDSSMGLMQINLIHCGEYGLFKDKVKCKEQLIKNIPLNINIGAQILLDSYNTWKGGRTFEGCSNRGIFYSGWDAAIRGYIGWGCGKDRFGNKIYLQDSYVEEVVERTRLLKKLSNNSVTYSELKSSKGILWWKKESFEFSVEYSGIDSSD